LPFVFIGDVVPNANVLPERAKSSWSAPAAFVSAVLEAAGSWMLELIHNNGAEEPRQSNC